MLQPDLSRVLRISGKYGLNTFNRSQFFDSPPLSHPREWHTVRLTPSGPIRGIAPQSVGAGYSRFATNRGTATQTQLARLETQT